MELSLDRVLREIEGDKNFKLLEKSGLLKIFYRLNSPKLFENPLKRELRGIVFDKFSKKVVSRPFHKFFNVNESEETREEKLFGKEFIVREKLDGTMIHFAKYQGEVIPFTLRSFSSPHLGKVREILKRGSNLSNFIEEVLNKNCTPIFELLSEDFQLVIPYQGDRLVLTEIRENRSGKYLLEKYVHQIEGIEIAPGGYKANYEKIKSLAEGKEFVEGFVLKDFTKEEPFPLFVKLKSSWYYETHYAFTYLNNVPPHKLFLLYLQNKWDDLLSRVTNENLREKRKKELESLVKEFEGVIKLVERARNGEELLKNYKGRLPPSVVLHAFRLKLKGKNYEKFLEQKFYESLKRS